MRWRMVPALLALLGLTACQGGLLPVPTAPPTITPDGRTLVPVRTGLEAESVVTSEAPDHSAAAQRAAPQSAPEVRAGLLSGEDRERYERLLATISERDGEAGEWLRNTGVFLRDAKLDAAELEILSLLANGKTDALWCVSNVRQIGGISEQELAYFKGNTVRPGANWYFDDDVGSIEAHDLLSIEGKRSLLRSFERAHSDGELRKGLYIINTLGLPDPRGFRRPVPGYNVQLYLFMRLLEQGVPGAYEKAAVAAALTYGSLLTLGDAEAQKLVEQCAYERVRFLIDTDVLLAAAGAEWRAVDYPLEALIVLLWGGEAAALPEPEQPLEQAPSLWSAALQRPLTADEMQRVLVRVADLRSMQNEMVRAVIDRGGDAAAACSLVEEWWAANRREEADLGGPNLGQQWARYREGRGFAGGAQSAYVLAGLAASINLPVPWVQLWYVREGKLAMVPFGLRLDPRGNTLLLGASAQRALMGVPDAHLAALVWWRAPWDNWRLPDTVRGVQTLPLPLSVWHGGVPAGYLMRETVSSESEALSALGVPAP